mgnify:CR=1 FL=1
MNSPHHGFLHHSCETVSIHEPVVEEGSAGAEVKKEGVEAEKKAELEDEKKEGLEG